jgi:integrase
MEKPFLIDIQKLKSGLIIFRRGDVQHKNWYCRIKVPESGRYKTISLHTSDVREATDKAFEYDGDIRFRVKHQVPVFDKSFAEVAEEFLALQKRNVGIGKITKERWQTVDGHVRLHLIPYVGNMQITSVTHDKWTDYPFWRKENNAPKKQRKHPLYKKPKEPQNKEPEEHKAASNGSIRAEMITFRSIMTYAASRNYIRENQVPKGDMPENKNRREAFNTEEWRSLHTFARMKWKDEPTSHLHVWYRNMAYNFMLIMGNTGMRNSEARSLKWRDVDIRKTKDGRSFVVMNVRGKGKYRELIAASNVVEYLDRVKALFKEAQKHEPASEDAVFTTFEGKSAKSLYDSIIRDLLTASGLLYGSNHTIPRSIYSFRHTYATFRLMEGIDVYFLAKQMGTSVKMIEDYYGHIAPAKNAERILQGMPGWEPIAEVSGEKAASVNAGAAGTKAKPRKK